MGTEVLKIYIILGVILLILLGAGFYYVFNESVPNLPIAGNPSNPFEPTLIQNGSSTMPKNFLSDIEDLARAKIQITTSDKNKITVNWANLPPGTNRIVIFRSNLRTSGVWVRWSTITVGSGENGSAEITLKTGEDATAYTYYAQAFSDAGYTLWASQITEAEPPLPPPSASSTSTATSTGQIAQGGQPPSPPPTTGTTPPPTTSSTPPTNSPPTPPPSGNPTSTTNPPPVPPPSGPPVAYYTPSGQIAGYFTPQLDPFWVTHVNQNIEIGWQNLPPPTDALVVYRSQSQNGPWNELMMQTHPSTSTKDFVRLVDYTISESYYYRMDALDSTQIIAAYEPIFLPGIGQ